jgi:hypothetical protein
MNTRIIPVALISLLLSARVALAQSCDCAENYTSLNQMLKEDYPGWDDKTNNERFQQFHDSLYQALRNEKDPFLCYRKLNALILFLKDRHLSLGINPSPEINKSIRQFYSNIKEEVSPVPDDSFSDPIKGLWELKGGGTFYRIRFTGNKQMGYSGVIVQSDSLYWFPGQVKVFVNRTQDANQYIGKTFLRDHTAADVAVRVLAPNILDFGAYGIWQRVGDSLQDLESKKAIWERQQVAAKQIGKNTLYLKVPSFDLPFFEPVKKVVDSLKRTALPANMIIDLRDNGGGSILVSNMLLDYVYTGPIKMAGSAFKTSERNIKDQEALVSNKLINNKFDTVEFKERIAKYRAAPNSLFTTDEDYEITMDSVYVFPNRVYILMNRFSGSATELFILQARQSGKVTLVGENTRGAIDYTNLGSPHQLPCSFFYYRVPMFRNSSVNTDPIDGTGIPPGISVPFGTDGLLMIKQALKIDSSL